MKTAVEWLVEELKSRSIDLSKWNNDLLEQSKEMEKQHIIDAYYVGNDDVKDNPYREAKQYYNETFKK